MSVPYAKRLKYLDAERMRLRKLLAEQVVENGVIKYALRKSGDRTGAEAAGAGRGVAFAVGSSHPWGGSTG